MSLKKKFSACAAAIVLSGSTFLGLNTVSASPEPGDKTPAGVTQKQAPKNMPDENDEFFQEFALPLPVSAPGRDGKDVSVYLILHPSMTDVDRLEKEGTLIPIQMYVKIAQKHAQALWEKVAAKITVEDLMEGGAALEEASAILEKELPGFMEAVEVESGGISTVLGGIAPAPEATPETNSKPAPVRKLVI